MELLTGLACFVLVTTLGELQRRKTNRQKADRRRSDALTSPSAPHAMWVGERPTLLRADLGGHPAELLLRDDDVLLTVYGLCRDLDLIYLGSGDAADLSGPRLTLGDPGFDERFAVSGDLRTALAVLGPTQRAMLQTSHKRGLLVHTLREGTLRATINVAWGDPSEAAKEVHAMLPPLLELGEPDRPYARLLEHLKHEDAPEVQAHRLIELLLRGSAADRAEALRLVQHTAEPRVALLAAAGQGDPVAIGEALHCGALERPTVVSGAVGAVLPPRLSRERQRAIGLTLLRATAPEARAAGAVLLVSASASGDAEVEDALIAAAASAHRVEIQALADALARLGTLRCMPALSRAEDDAPDAATRQSWEWARLAVHGRNKGAEAGGVSLVETQGPRGALALPDGGGGVAIVEGGELATPQREEPTV